MQSMKELFKQILHIQLLLSVGSLGVLWSVGELTCIH